MDKVADYIEYWDLKVNDWFQNTDKTDIYLMNLSGFQMDGMPEPYLGNPLKCSIAILNFNPGQINKDPEQSRMYELYMNLVKENRYSSIATFFPYLQTRDFLNENGLSGFEKYDGSKWWQNRNSWVEHLITTTGKDNKEKLTPFALELCPWHSLKWDSKRFISSLADYQFKNYINKYVIGIYEKAISNSLCGFGVCVGKSFGRILEQFGYSDETCKYYFCSSDDGIQLYPEKERYYKVYRKGETTVLNTWHQGGNRTPSMDFWDKETELINKMEHEVERIKKLSHGFKH